MTYIRRVLGLFVIFAAIAASTLSANAQTTPLNDDDPFVQHAKVYADIFGVSLDTAILRLQLIHAEPDLEAKLLVNEKDTFAGLWVEHQPIFRVVIQFTGNGEQTIRRYIEKGPWANIVEVRSARLSYAKLKADQEQVVQII